MKDYLIVGDTLRESMYCYNYLLRLMLPRGKITYASRAHRLIYIDEYRLRFTCDELYWRPDRLGRYNFEILNSRYVERLLDMYRTFVEV